MIPQIKEIEGKFPKYATLSQATVTLNDMGDKTISTQIKIDGGIAPDFSYDWEVEFQGERYIQPLREPQASKGNESLSSTINLVFQHKTIYDLKRYYFVQMAPLESSTAVVDKYIASLSLNLGEFIEEFKRVLNYWFPENEITVEFNDAWQYDEEPSYIEIRYSHIWDVLLQLHEVYGVRWTIEGNVIRIGYDTEEVNHIFQYGYEGGLLKVERQVQNDKLANSLLGRGGDRNLPYRYFKDVDEHTPSFQADPDWIPELAKISFGNLRGKTFRDYVQGWKTNPNRQLLEGMSVEAYDEVRGNSKEGWAYKLGHEAVSFDPVEYVEDVESIKKYGPLQNGLDDAEDIYPTIQGVEIDGLGRIDEIVKAEEVRVDEVNYSSNITHSYNDRNVTKVFTVTQKGKQNFEIVSEPFSIKEGMIGVIFDYLTTVSMVATGNSIYYDYVGGIKYNQTATTRSNIPIQCKLESIRFYDADTDEELVNLSNLTQDLSIYYKAVISNTNAAYRFDNNTYTTTEYGTTIDPNTGFQYSYPFEVTHDTWYEMEPEFELSVNVYVPLYEVQFGGEVIPNTKDNKPISGSIQITPNSEGKLVLEATDVVVAVDRTTLLDIPIRIDAYKSSDSTQSLKGSVEYKKNIILSNKLTGEVTNLSNLSAGEYYCRVEVECYNNASENATFVASLLPTYLLPPTDSAELKPFFSIWVKNLWGTTRNEGESGEAYTNRVWTPILGDRVGNEAKVVFSTGWLSGHSDYEFTIKKVVYAGDKGYHNEEGVPAEWEIVLIKSDAEIEATGKWIPSTTQQAMAGDKFFFIGIDMPHQYVLWAEEKLDQYKRDQLLETANIKPTWVVQTDKVRLNESRDGKKLLDSFKVGNTLLLHDDRFLKGEERLYMQSITYTWGANTHLLPDVEVVLSDKYEVSANPVSKLQGEVDALTKQVGSISNIQQIVRAVGDKLYLRKDGMETVSDSPTTFNNVVNSRNYRQGAVGGNGWGLRSEQGKGIIEVDKLIVRDEMQVNSLVVNQVSAIGGKEILSAASITCSRVGTTERGFKCYFDQKRGSVANLFVEHDIAYSQVFNANDITVKFYKREVIEVGDNYILLSLDSGDDSNGAPQVGDVIAQYGNTKVSERQYVIIRDVIGGGYERMLSDLDSVNAEGVEYYFAGRLEGGTPRWFVGDAEGDYAEWKDGTLKIKGKLAVGSDVGGATVVEGGLVTAETIALGKEGTINAGITGKGNGDDAIRFWAGATEDNKENAPFKVYDDGTVVVNGEVNATKGSFKNGVFDNVTINGSISSPFKEFIGTAIYVRREGLFFRESSEDEIVDSKNYYAWKSYFDGSIAYTLNRLPTIGEYTYRISDELVSQGSDITSVTNDSNGDIESNVNKHDNLAIDHSFEKYDFDEKELDWSPKNSGRIIRLLDTRGTKYTKFHAPQGKYFYENGEQVDSLIFSNEIIELLGYGSSNNFYGWIVTNRRDVKTNRSQGSPSNVLYQGVIRGGKITKVWTPIMNHAGYAISQPTYDSSSGLVVLPMPDAYRGLDDANNWEVFCTNAVVKAKRYLEGNVRFQIQALTGAEYVVFQVISTADWAKI